MNIEEAIFCEIKKAADEEGISQTNLIKLFLLEGLKQLKSSKKKKKKNSFTFPTFGKGGLQPGVNLQERSQLIDFLDE